MNYALTTIPAIKSVYDAIRALSGNCDGARTRDNVGFNGRDTEFGKSIAEREISAWTPKIYASAYKMLRTYRNSQLPELGFDYATMMPVLPESGSAFVAGYDQDSETFAIWYGTVGIVAKDYKEFADAATASETWNGALISAPTVSAPVKKSAPVCARCKKTATYGDNLYCDPCANILDLEDKLTAMDDGQLSGYIRNQKVNADRVGSMEEARVYTERVALAERIGRARFDLPNPTGYENVSDDQLRITIEAIEKAMTRMPEDNAGDLQACQREISDIEREQQRREDREIQRRDRLDSERAQSAKYIRDMAMYRH